MSVPCSQASAVKPAEAMPAGQPQTSRSLPDQERRQEGHGRGDGQVEVRRHHDQQPPAVAQQEEHGGYVYKKLGDCPAQGTVTDLLEWAVPTDADHCGHGGQVRDQDRPAALKDQGVDRAERDQLHPEP